MSIIDRIRSWLRRGDEGMTDRQRGAAAREWASREGVPAVMHPTSVFHTTQCACPPVGVALAGPTQPCAVHAHMYGTTSNSLKIGA